MKVQVAYAASSNEFLCEVEVSEGENIRHAINQSNVLDEFPEISLEKNKVGIFGEIVELDHELHEGDRIEIYQALKMDPMEARRLRAKSQ